MKVFLAIQSCDADRKNRRQDASLGTYLAGWPGMIDYRYFVGQGCENLRQDEVLVNAPDDYEYCAWKTRAAARFTLSVDADFMFHCTTDTYIVLPRLLAAIPRVPYLGHLCDDGQASGGCGYWLGRSALERVAMAVPEISYEDLWVARTLGIYAVHDPRYHNAQPFYDDWGRGVIAAHLGRGTGVFDPAWMYQAHDNFARFCDAQEA